VGGNCPPIAMTPQQKPTHEQQVLFSETVREVLQRLEVASDQSSLFSALRWGMSEMDRVLAATAPKVKASIACRSGCYFCCSVPIGVQAHEVFLAADFIQTHFPPDEIAAIIVRTAMHRKRVAGLDAGTYSKSLQPCALLRDGRCSIYEARPEICRAHHASDAKVCEAYVSDQSVAVQTVYIPPLRRRMFAVMLGIDEAFEEAGFDDQAYDFGSALHEALTNSLCITLWARQKMAFPDSCLEP
jgi:Fe-S-cluster containining protein